MIDENSCEILLEGLDESNVSSILQKWKEISDVKKKLEELDEMLKNKVRVFMKERKWDKYNDADTKITVSLGIHKKESINKDKLKEILSESQLVQIMRTTTYEKLLILTPESRARLKKYVNRKKI